MAKKRNWYWYLIGGAVGVFVIVGAIVLIVMLTSGKSDKSDMPSTTPPSA